MSTPIKQGNPNPLSQAQVQDYMYSNPTSYLTGHTVDSNDVGKEVNASELATAAQTFGMPELTALNDGNIYTLRNSSYFKVTISPNGASDKIWNSGEGYGIELPDKGSYVVLRGNYAGNSYDIIGHGGRVVMEGLVLHEPMDSLTLYGVGNTSDAVKLDKTETKVALGVGGVTAGYEPSNFNSNFGKSGYTFNGTTGHLKYEDSTDWNLFGTQTGHKTVAGWVLNDNNSLIETYVSHYVDVNNMWRFLKSGTTLIVNKYSSGTDDVAISCTLTVTQGNWYHIALVVYGSVVGLYINGVQVGYSTGWAAEGFNAPLYFGTNGASNYYLDGRMQDWHISYNNPYNAAPNSGLTDSFTVPGGLFQGVMN